MTLCEETKEKFELVIVQIPILRGGAALQDVHSRPLANSQNAFR